MSTKFETMKALIADWSRGDIDAALSYMTDDIVWHYAVAIAAPITGKAAAARALHRFSSQQSENRWRLFDHAERGERLFVEGVDEYVDTEGRVISSPYAGVLEFRGDLICAWRDYFDMATVEAQKAGQAAPDWVAALIDRPAAAPSTS